MSDSPKLETASQHLARARFTLERLIERDPQRARAILRRPTGPIGWTQDDERSTAWRSMLQDAVDVRCIHRCEHVPKEGAVLEGPGIALLATGVYACDECMDRFADAEPRGDGLCDLCDRPTPRPGEIDHPLPDGPTVKAKTMCNDCALFYQSLPWNRPAEPA